MQQRIFKGEPDLEIATSLNNLGEAYRGNGNYDKAIQHYMESILILRFLCKDHPHPYIATMLSNIGNVYIEKGDYDAAIKHHIDSP